VYKSDTERSIGFDVVEGYIECQKVSLESRIECQSNRPGGPVGTIDFEGSHPVSGRHKLSEMLANIIFRITKDMVMWEFKPTRVSDHRLALAKHKIVLQIIICKASRAISIAITMVLVAYQAAHAELPTFPRSSIAPLYGEWENAMGKGRVKMKIAQKWITTLDGWCPQRSRYQVISIGVRTLEGVSSLEIVIKIFGAEFLGKNSQLACPAHRLDDAYLDIELPDQGEAPSAPIGVFTWRACDSLEHLKQPIDSEHPNVKSCGAGGGVMDRVTKAH
jgi:hypothetical protein